MENAPVRFLVISIPGQRVIIEKVFLFPGIYWRGMRREKRKERERGRESLCRLNILTDESPLAMLRMEIVGPDSAVTARRQIINFSLDAKRIPLSVCSPPPSTVCLPFFLPLSFHPSACPFRDVYLISRNGKILAACSRRSWQPVVARARVRPFYSNFFFFSPSFPASRILFSQRRTPGRKTSTLSSLYSVVFYHVSSYSFVSSLPPSRG